MKTETLIAVAGIGTLVLLARGRGRIAVAGINPQTGAAVVGNIPGRVFVRPPNVVNRGLGRPAGVAPGGGVNPAAPQSEAVAAASGIAAASGTIFGGPIGGFVAGNFVSLGGNILSGIF